MRIHCIYHDNCHDGLMSAAIIAKEHQGEEIFFRPYAYQDDPPELGSLISADYVYIVDFSFNREVMQGLINELGSRLTVLDHHKTAQKELENLSGTGVEGSYVLFDLEKSGCLLTWEFFFTDPPPLSVMLVNDRDLWKLEMDDTAAFNYGLKLLPKDPLTWCESLLSSPDQNITSKITTNGWSVKNYVDLKIDGILEVWKRNPTYANVYDYEEECTMMIPIMNITDLDVTSEFLHKLSEFNDGIAMSYFDTHSHRIFSIRSTEESGIDVSSIALCAGGGGHANAAGFSVPLGSVDVKMGFKMFSDVMSNKIKK